MVRVVCPYCGYSWDSRARGRYLKCPSCYRGFRNPYWGSPTTSTTKSPEIGVWIADCIPELWRDLRELAEEVSGPDPSGVEVLVLDAGVAVEVLRHYGMEVVG